MKLDGASAVITGGSRGIGRAVARELSARGARLVLVARGERELRRTAEELGATAVVADLADPEACDDVIREAHEAVGHVDLVVNNAAIVRPAGVSEMSDRDLQQQMQCNLIAPMHLVHRVLPGMIERGHGHIVNVSSGAAALPLANMSNYCASKAGLLHYTASLRSEVSHLNIGTTVVELGTVPGTDAYRAALEDERLRRLYARLGRVGLMHDTSAEEVAARVADAIEHNRPYVRVPRTARVAWALNSVVRDATYSLFRSRPQG